MELIDRKVLKAKLEKIADMNNPKQSYDSMMIAKIMIEILNEAPAVEERKQGCWKNGCCTVCGESAATDGHFDFIPEEEQKYCWNCGAIMDGQAICND